MWIALLLFVVGLGLSAFFSGSETGFYRVGRVRLVIDALAGDWIAKGLLWATNNPSVFVATALVGNNLANYLVSSSAVMAGAILLPGAEAGEMILTLLVTPLVFIYGELLPKQLFYEAPYRLLRRCAPGLGLAGVLFAPVSAVLWGVGLALQRLAGTPSQTLRQELARRELANVLDEGHAVGLLAPAQRRLAQGTLAAAGRSLREFMIPTARLPKASASYTRRQLLEFAQRRGQWFVVLADGSGYVRAVDCLLDSDSQQLPVRQLMTAQAGDSFLPTLLRMQTAGREVSAVQERGRVVGYVFAEGLRNALGVDQGL